MIAPYSVQDESSRIFHTQLIENPKLNLPVSFTLAANNVQFTGADPEPFIPSPCKMTESSSALNALVAAAASAVAHDRYNIGFQDIKVNT
jgi:hypothetical protein